MDTDSVAWANDLSFNISSSHSDFSLPEVPAIAAFAAEYQPIVHAQSLEVHGYEALARFYKGNGAAISPARVFEALHSQPEQLANMEYRLKQHQLAGAPSGQQLLFINLDPHALSEQMAPALLDMLNQRRENLVVELIENTDLQDSQASIALLAQLQERAIKTALDDIGTPDALVSVELLVSVDYLKFDRYWLQLLEQPAYEALFRQLIAFAREVGRYTILEGVETLEQLALVKRYPLDYIQGFLFKPQFRQTAPEPFER